jgi:hypothetical protein
VPEFYFEIGGDDSALMLSACVIADDAAAAVRILRERIATPQHLAPTGVDATTHVVLPRNAAGEYINLHIVFDCIGAEDIGEVRSNVDGVMETEAFDVDDIQAAVARIDPADVAAIRGVRPSVAHRPHDRRAAWAVRHVTQRVEVQQSVRFDCPELFARDDFRRWLNNGFQRHYGSRAWEHAPVATWHRGGEPHDNSDVFMYYDHGELSDHISDEVDEILIATWQASGAGQYGVLWLVNGQS